MCIWLFILAITAGACSSDSEPSTTATAPTSSRSATPPTQSPPQDASDISGPIVFHCHWTATPTPDPGTTISKLNIKTGELKPIAQFPVGGCDGVRATKPAYGTSYPRENNFVAQGLTTLYSPDWRKRVIDLGPGLSNHVGYYDLQLGNRVDVSEIVNPAGGDFDVEPKHSSPLFTRDGLFRFIDNVAKEVKYFDTNSKRVVRSAPYSGTNDAWPPGAAVDAPEWLRWVATPGKSDFRTCMGLWVIDDRRYLRVKLPGDEGSGINHDRYLAVDTIPAAHDDSGMCDRWAGTQISPLVLNGPLSAAADPTGSTILFVIEGKDRENKLYRANTASPESPTEIKVQGGLGDYGDTWTIVDWQ